MSSLILILLNLCGSFTEERKVFATRSVWLLAARLCLFEPRADLSNLQSGDVHD